MSNKPSGSLLKNLMDYVTQVNINIFEMAQKEKNLKSEVKLPSYITLPSTWFLEDTKSISDKRLAPTKGTAEMDKIIDKYENLVSDSFETSSTTVQNNIDKTIDILFKVNDLYINDVQDFTIIKIKHSAGMGQQGSTEEIRSGEVGDDERDLVINFITDSISISDKIREEFVVQLVDKLKISSDLHGVARVCNNINKYGENRFMLTAMQRDSINKFCTNVKTQDNQTKKQQPKQTPKSSFWQKPKTI